MKDENNYNARLFLVPQRIEYPVGGVRYVMRDYVKTLQQQWKYENRHNEMTDKYESGYEWRDVEVVILT